MNFAIVGLGNMGKAVRDNAVKRGHEFIKSFGKNDEITKINLENIDLVFESTLPSVAVDNILQIVSAKKDCVVATTAWYDRLEEVERAVKENKTRLIYSNNYSIGAALYEKIVEFSAKLFNKVEDYDVWGHEIHHRNKVESPSGTAKNLEKILLKNIDGKTKVVEEALLYRKPKPEELHFSSTRAGYNNFSHTVAFDSEAQVVEMKHTSKTRDAFSIDTVKAGEWLKKQKPGIYTMQDFLEDILK